MREIPRKIVPAGAWPSLVLLFLLHCLLPSQLLGESYLYEDIHPPGWIDSRVTCMNGRGEAVGFGATTSGERGFLWSSGRITEILPPGAGSAQAVWINDSGEVAGTFVRDGVRHAFLLRGTAYLDPTPGWRYSEAAYLGEDGAVGGKGEFGAFVSRGGAVEVFPGFSAVVSGNSSGEIVGTGNGTALLYLPNQGYRDLTPPGTNSAFPLWINENGWVAVNSRQSGVDRGFVFSDPFFVSMTPSGWTSSNAMAVNNQDMVAGYGDSPEGRRSFLRREGTYEILSFPGWSATEAAAINDLGQVAGSGTTATGETHAFVASPPGAPAAKVASPGLSGGCAMAPRGEGREMPASDATGLMLLIPLLMLRGRRLGRKPTPRRS
jgi:probable HAF family extracellular repeat protein